MHSLDIKLLELLLYLPQVLLLTGDLNSHIAPDYLVLALEQFYALEGLLLRRLVGLDCEVDLLDCLLDGLVGEPALGARVHAFLHDDVDDLGQDCRLLGVTLLICYL